MKIKTMLCVCVCVYVFVCAFLTQKVPNTVSTMKACTETCMSEIIPDVTGADLTRMRTKDFHKHSMKHIVDGFSPASEWWQTLSRWRTSTSAACTGQPGM